ncbi:MAG: hypothetical protein JWO25_1663 [Alphaproteobacteria bacterium]|nr:hypothetical protein [Alphaproteobacteria bacterium]MDB5721703.1 hypothetical protein [Alphaproteobacteria bacterium]
MNASSDSMRTCDRGYFRQRAEAEIEAAYEARHPEAARAHYLLAAYYLDLTHNPASQPSTGFASATQ